MTQGGSNNDALMTVRELALLLRDWLATQRDARAQSQESLGAILRPEHAQQADEARQQRTRRFREALAGMESLLVSDGDLDYRAVLDHVMHNVGASLQSVGLIGPEGGLVAAPVLDMRHQPLYPALLTPRRYVALPSVTRALHGLGIGRPRSLTAHLVEYHVWQPRRLRSPGYADERFGLFLWRDLASNEILFLPTSRVPRSALLGGGECAVLEPRPPLLSRLFGVWGEEGHVARLAPRDFTALLRALLLDYEALHTARQQELVEHDQLGSMLWSFLTRGE